LGCSQTAFSVKNAKREKVKIQSIILLQLNLNIFIFFHISFSMVTLVAHLSKALMYLPPAKYIPAKKARCAIIIKIGPPMIINKGSCQ